MQWVRALTLSLTLVYSEVKSVSAWSDHLDLIPGHSTSREKTGNQIPDTYNIALHHGASINVTTTGLTDLPQSIQDIAEVVGRENALIIAERCKVSPSRGAGDTGINGCLYIPKVLPPDHFLREWIGDDDAEALCAEFAGIRLYPSKCRGLAKNQRNELIRADLTAGLTIKDAAEKYKMTPRNMRIIARKVANDTKEEKPPVDA